MHPLDLMATITLYLLGLAFAAAMLTLGWHFMGAFALLPVGIGALAVLAK